MGYKISIEQMCFGPNKTETILNNINMSIEPGQFVALLGENGAGKTTLLDMAMGFKRPTSGTITIDGITPQSDPYKQRNQIAYLSEKVDIPGDWTVDTFLKFNKYFYKEYSESFEKHLIHEFKINLEQRIGNLSAGEIRRIQLVGALSINPKLIVVDEITAVLDIIGRKKFMHLLKDYNQKNKTTIILATNILEDLEQFISHVALMQKGELSLFQEISEFIKQNQQSFSDHVAHYLEEAA